MKTFNIQTLGCQMNERDSETLRGMLMEMSYREEPDRYKADIAIINTCSIRENADKRFFGMLGQYKKVKRENSDFIMCVCGCMMQQQHIIDKLKLKYPWVDVIFGTHNIHHFPDLLKSTLDSRKRIIEIFPEGGDIVEGLPWKRLYKHKAFVNIMYGCNNFCTYCIVPYTRGRERSRKPENIEEEVRTIVDEGVKEVTLLGQNVNSYKGADNVDFAALLEILHPIDGLERLRFMTSHPKDISPKLIESMGRLPKLGSYIHLPVQSGSDRILKAMNRHYKREDYLNIISKMREVNPNIAISTDIIVGFPGETETDFEHTLELVREVGFDSAFTFLYSIRRGTPAASFDEQVPEEIKHDRFNRLVEEVNQFSGERNAARVGRVERVLVDGMSRNNESNVTGRTEQNKIVNFKGSSSLQGRIVEVEITSANTFSLEGKMKEC